MARGEQIDVQSVNIIISDTVGPGSFRLVRVFGSGGFPLTGPVGLRCTSGRDVFVSYGVPGRAGFWPPCS